MKRLFSRLTLLGALALAMAMVSQGTASADPGGSIAIVTGSGFINPGLTDTPTSQDVSFNGSGVGAGILVHINGANSSAGTAAGAFSCSFSGTGSPPQTTLQGSGTVSGTCSGGTVGTASLSCTATYSRVGVIVTVTLDCNAGLASGPLGVGTTAHATGAGVFVFVPTSAPGAPVTSYALAGAAAGVSPA